jgi:hypothetical protein
MAPHLGEVRKRRTSRKAALVSVGNHSFFLFFQHHHQRGFCTQTCFCSIIDMYTTVFFCGDEIQKFYSI